MTVMTKEKIILDNEIVTENFIHVDCDHTQFCKIERISLPNIKELEKQVKAFRKELKEKKVKLNKTNTLKLLKEKEEYNAAVKEYNDTFDKLVDSWKIKLEDGLYVGYSDDELYNETLKPLEWKLEKMFNRSELLYNIKKIESNLNHIKQELKFGTEYISVSI
ncbi:hypothetical protein PQ478_08675 [Alkalihalophilus pseudofirmus]|uniref:hypothetical protein n=1 Tax=Alkalihalophilus pseudofirmus TaxID=79885 RepID=UPI00259BE6E5|nr:hypothetical protein [Alkalihalophilus pseudofirmus]WEG18543.1 hypothetical protein PQ478_08675 [Alkalihalophilus pseudofirmus]